MRIVHIEDFFHPDAGYQINILTKYQVRQGHEVIVVTSEMQKMPRYLTNFFGTDNIEEKDRDFTEKNGCENCQKADLWLCFRQGNQHLRL